MPEALTDQIGKELILRKEGRPSERRLEFDPTSGELVVRRRDESVSTHVTPVDQIITDGFA